MAVGISAEGIDVGIVARDPQALLAFYGEFLGLPEVRQLDLSDSAGVVLHFLQAGSSHVKIVAPKNAPAAENPPGGLVGATGIRYVTMPVTSLDEIVAGLAAAGGEMLQPMIDFEGMRVAIIADPEGNAVELVEGRS